MKRICLAALALATVAWPAHALTVSNGVVLFNQADAINGNVTPGDAPGYPVTISASGVYRLAGNMAPTSGANGIEVTAPEVTIDFFGFRMAGGAVAARGVVGSQRALTVTNGTIRGFTTNGIYVTAEQLVVTNMRISDVSGSAIQEYFAAATSGSATVKNSEIFNNNNGVTCNAACHIESNNISRNSVFAVSIIGEGGAVLSNTLFGNGGGIYTQGVKGPGVGNNSIIGNTTSISGTYKSLYPNACDPAC